MPSTIAQKLRIRDGSTLLLVDAPPAFKKTVEPLTKEVKFISSGKVYDQVHWFVKNKAEMEKGIKKVLPLVKGDVICWIYYPKGTSGIQTDLNRDNGWEELLKHDMQWVNLISFDDTWSAFGMREKTEVDRRKEAKPKQRPIFDYVDPKSKTINLPDDFGAALKKAKKQEAFFNTLSFTNKKEYIEWIVTAKREETRAARVKESIERLGKEWKNPANR